MTWVSKEVIEHLETNYHLSSPKNWTLGGFSNGGAVVLKINSSIPVSFGNIISMSPASNDFELTKTESRYFLCAGTEEPHCYAKSLEIAEFFQKHNMEFEHRTYLSGHNINMWRNYYFDCLTKIYQN
jgi:enterochelin esterase-like enzyme